MCAKHARSAICRCWPSSARFPKQDPSAPFPTISWQVHRASHMRFGLHGTLTAAVPACPAAVVLAPMAAYCVGQACTALRELELGELDGMCHLAVGAPAPVIHRSQLAAFGHNKPFLRSLSLSSKVRCARRRMLFCPTCSIHGSSSAVIWPCEHTPLCLTGGGA